MTKLFSFDSKAFNDTKSEFFRQVGNRHSSDSSETYVCELPARAISHNHSHILYEYRLRDYPESSGLSPFIIYIRRTVQK